MAKKKIISLPGRIIYTDDVGERAEVTAPSLIALFFSDKLAEEFEKKPHNKYSIKELWEMANKQCSKSSISRNIEMKYRYFERGEKLDYTKQGLMSINVATLKPVVKNILDAVKRIKKEYEDDE